MNTWFRKKKKGLDEDEGGLLRSCWIYRRCCFRPGGCVHVSVAPRPQIELRIEGDFLTFAFPPTSLYLSMHCMGGETSRVGAAGGGYPPHNERIRSPVSIRRIRFGFQLRPDPGTR